MGHAPRLGLKVFDPLEILEADRIRRDLLLVDKIAFDEAQLKLVRDYAKLLCELHDEDPGTKLRQFDEDWTQLESLGRLERVSLDDAAPPKHIAREIERLEEAALGEIKKKFPCRVALPNGRTTSTRSGLTR